MTDRALARLVGGWFWYGEVRGAAAFSRWAREAAELPWTDVRLRFLHAYARQTAEEWGHVALWSRWLERHRLDPAEPVAGYVALMDAQDAATTWCERLAGTHLVIEAMALAFLPDLAPLVPDDLRRAIEQVRRDEEGHVALAGRWIRVFVERGPDELPPPETRESAPGGRSPPAHPTAYGRMTSAPMAAISGRNRAPAPSEASTRNL